MFSWLITLWGHLSPAPRFKAPRARRKHMTRSEVSQVKKALAMGYTQVDIANAIGRSRIAINSIARGVAHPDSRAAHSLQDWLKYAILRAQAARLEGNKRGGHG